MVFATLLSNIWAMKIMFRLSLNINKLIINVKHFKHFANIFFTFQALRFEFSPYVPNLNSTDRNTSL